MLNFLSPFEISPRLTGVDQEPERLSSLLTGDNTWDNGSQSQMTSTINQVCTQSGLYPFSQLNNDELLDLYNDVCTEPVSSNVCRGSHDRSQVSSAESYLAPENINLHFDSTFNSTKDLVAVHVNMRSLIKNIDNLTELILRIPYKPDIIAISETKLNNTSILKSAELQGYSLLYQNSLSRAGGVAIYIKIGIKFLKRPELCTTDNIHEIIFIELVNSKKNMKNSLFGVVYRHPQNPIVNFHEKFSDKLDKIMIENKYVYITGDANIDLLKINTSTHINNYSNMLSSYNICNTVKLATRVCNKSQTLIDHFYTNNINNINKASVLITDISDHYALLVTIKKTKSHIIPTKNGPLVYRSYNALDIDNLKFDTTVMTKQLWYSYNSLKDLDIHQKFDMLTTGIRSVFDKHAPLKKLSRKQKQLRMKPWITKEITKAIRIRNKMYQNLHNNKFKDTELHKQYKKYRNILTNTKEKSKQNYFKNEFKNCKGDSAKTWKVINNIISDKSKASNIPTELETSNNTFTSSHQQILNSLNIHFANIGKSQHSQNIDLNQISFYLKIQQKNSIVLQDTTATEISNIITSLDPNKASGADEVSVKLLQIIKSIISPLLSSLINDCFKTGTYPDCQKIAKVIPIFKGGSKTKPGNYRPISLLSIINKIIEKTIHSRLTSYLDKYNLITDNQFGFRKGYNTTMAVTEFYEKLLNSKDEGYATCAVLLDLSKAFDSVNHTIILHKLYQYGIRGNAWKLFQSYLRNRVQFVSDNTSKSNYTDVNIGVPQGSVLGPLLFLLHINDLKNSTRFDVLNFADDTLLYWTFNNPHKVQQDMNIEMKKVKQWLDINHLTLNETKTKYMLFSPKLIKYKNINLTLKFNNSEIERVKEYKYLGLILDDKLTWNSHLKQIKNKLSKSLGILYKLRHILNKAVLKIVLHSLFISHIQYGILCWARCAPGALEPIQIMLNKAMRCINFCNHREQVIKFLHKDQILLIEDMFKLELAKFMFNFKSGSLPGNFSKYFIKLSSQHSYQTRAAKSGFFKPRKQTNRGQRGLRYCGPGLWSEIPDSLKDEKSVIQFGSKYKKFLLDKYI